MSGPSQSVPRLPTLYLELSEMRPSQNFRQRYSSADGSWLPPRPWRSNIRNSSPTWYTYQQGSTSRLPAEPDRRQRQMYRTYSFYCSANRLFIYPSNALRHKVGDGEGNPRISSSPFQNTEGDSSDMSDVDYSREAEDWRELGFHWYTRENASISHAMFRGAQQTLSVQWPDQGHIRQLLPPQYQHNGGSVVQQGEGGMTGEIAVLIALIAYSVPSNRVDRALTSCLRTTYVPHQVPPGHGWIDRRGLVVSVWYEKERTPGGDPRATSATPTGAQRISHYELGQYPGYGKFVF